MGASDLGRAMTCVPFNTGREVEVVKGIYPIIFLVCGRSYIGTTTVPSSVPTSWVVLTPERGVNNISKVGQLALASVMFTGVTT